MVECTFIDFWARLNNALAQLAGAMGGAFFEGLVIAEAYKVFAQGGRRPDLYFWRSQDGLEVDLVLLLPGGLLPVEIKLTATPTVRHVDALTRFKTLAGLGPAAPGVLVCGVPEQRDLPGGNFALPWQKFPAWVVEQFGPLGLGGS